MKRGRLVGYSLLLSVLVLVAAGLYFRYDILDWYRLRNYQPSAAIIQLAERTTMQNKSRRIFYANHPVIAEDELFNEHCRDNEHSIVLGCYLPGQRGIYILDVTDERLNGIKEVTAAHELLHAAYERLSSKERQRIDALTQQVFEGLSNNRVRSTIESYRKQDPSSVPTELHSILGTEVAELPDELEQYYRRYFINRQRIVAMSEQYEQAFIERANLRREYNEQLVELKEEIDTLESQLRSDRDEVLALRDQLTRLRDNDEIDQYNQLVPVFNRRLNEFNRNVDHYESLVTQFNDILQKRNSIASEHEELIKAIDSKNLLLER